MSPSLRSIGVGTGVGADFTWGDEEREELVIEDAPCLERLVVFEVLEMDISVVSAQRLKVLGELEGVCHILKFGTAALLQVCTGMIYRYIFCSPCFVMDPSPLGLVRLYRIYSEPGRYNKRPKFISDRELIATK